MTNKRKRRLPRITEVSPAQEAPKRIVVSNELPIPIPEPEETLALISRLEQLRNSHVVTLIAAPNVVFRGDVVEKIYEQLRNIGKVPQIDLFLYSSGGQTEIPWRIITIIRDFCDRFAVLIPAIAYSAATHLAMGADEIVMGSLSELSPVDPVRSHPLLPTKNDEGKTPLLISVQDLRHCVEFIKREIGVSHSENIASSPEAMAIIISALFEKIHPLAIGAIQQSYALARLISTKALSTHMNPETEQEKIEEIVHKLSDGFFSHDYRIGWKEAKYEIGLNVTYANDELWETMWNLYKNYSAYFILANIKDDKNLARPIFWIDSIYERRILEQLLLIEEGGKSQPVGTNWLATPWSDHIDK